MKKYEVMYIFPESLKDDTLESTLQAVLEDVKRAGGEVKDVKPLGKRAFARTMKKQEAGHFVQATVLLDPGQVSALQARYRLNENLFRVQIVTPQDLQAPVAKSPAAREEGSPHAQS